MKKTCKHEITRALFAQYERAWIKTGYVYCLDCRKVLKRKMEELSNK